MRAYFFTNMYISPIQRGIQSAHALAEMVYKYQTSDSQYSDLLSWSQFHKTIIVLNAGYSVEIQSLVEFFNNPENPYTHSYFTESEEALNSALTCASIILPEKIYSTAELLRTSKNKAELQALLNATHEIVNHNSPSEQPEVWTFNQFELDLIPRLNRYGLA